MLSFEFMQGNKGRDYNFPLRGTCNADRVVTFLSATFRGRSCVVNLGQGSATGRACDGNVRGSYDSDATQMLMRNVLYHGRDMTAIQIIGYF